MADDDPPTPDSPHDSPTPSHHEPLPNPTDLRDHHDDPADIQVWASLTETGKAALDQLADATGDSRSKLLRDAWQAFAHTLAADDPDAFDPIHLNYLARRRQQRDRLVENRLDSFYKRVDDTISHRLQMDTEPERMDRIIENFTQEVEYAHQAGRLSDAVREKRLRYIRQQFREYEAAYERNMTARRNRTVADAMTKLDVEYRETLEHAVTQILDAAEQELGPNVDTERMQRARSLAREASRMDCAPSDATEHRVWQQVCQFAVEGSDGTIEHPDPCLLDRAAQAIADDQHWAAETYADLAATVYPNDLGFDSDDMLQRATQRATTPDESTTADDTGEMSPADPPTGPTVADADGGHDHDTDGEGPHDEREPQ